MSDLAFSTTDDPLFMSATRLAGLIRRGDISAREVVSVHIDRIETVNPVINAVVAKCYERALREADKADAERAAGRTLGPLHGVPMTIKDSFDTEGVVSTGGTMGRKGFIPGKDATVVARARAAGAILLGKSNTPEFTLGVGPKGTDNLVYGLTRNPYNPAHQPGASSGGAGAIVSAGGASFDIGSDVYGSIRDPSHACGIAGLKPTQGRCSRTGHIIGYGGLYESFQQTGPMARWVEDLALILPIIAGPDGSDVALQPVPLGDPADVKLKDLRVAFYAHNGLNPPTEEIQALVRQCAGYFAEAGCKVTQDMPPRMSDIAEARSVFSGASGGYMVKRLLEIHGTTEPYPDLYSGGKEAPTAELTEAAEALDAARSAQLAWFSKYDLILTPSSLAAALRIDRVVPPTPPPSATSSPPKRSPYYLGVYNTNGWPAGVVRAGTSKLDPGLPLGVQVVARPWREDNLLAALGYIERRTGGYQRPAL